MQYTYKKQVALPFAEAVEKTREALANEGFGIMTEIDVKATLKEKLDVDFDDYMILGACNPPFALKALTAEKQIGALLPCNVIVFVDQGSTFVSTMLPKVQLGIIENPALEPIAEEVESRLKRVVDAI